MLAIHADSHLDHNLTPAHAALLLSHFADRTGFFAETVNSAAKVAMVA